jgi:hypothetical protein
MPTKRKGTLRLEVSLVADASGTSKCSEVKKVKPPTIEVPDQGHPMCWPMPGLVFRIDAVKRIGPPAGPAGTERRPVTGKGVSKKTP